MRVVSFAFGVVFGLGPALVFAQATLIERASIIDGTGAPARIADVRVASGRIAAVGNLARLPNDSIVDGRGLTLAPGFIDTHSHHDRGLFSQRSALAAVSQGITTIVVGQDGGSRTPLRDFFARLDTEPAAVNVASYAGHGSLRGRVMGDDFARAATAEEIARMRSLLQSEMDAGALGLSTGLEYDPGIYSTPNEVLELAKVAGAAGGRYISHMRSEDREFWPALHELLRIGREAKLPVQISHMKLAMRSLWGSADSLVRALDRARADGIAVTADVYPYTMWQSTLTVLYPKRNFSDRRETEFILREVASPDDLLIGQYEPDTSYAGKTVRQIAALRRSDPATTLMALIAETQRLDAGESVVATGMDERDVARLLRWPHTNVCSDGSLDGAHPRGFGSFPRVLARYVREQRVLPLEEAIRKMTSLAATNVGLPDRGIIAPEKPADLVLFDARTIADQATTAQPHAVSVGIRAVWVNGTVVYKNGEVTGKYPGRTLRRLTSIGTDTTLAKVGDFVQAEMRRQRIPGVAIGIVKNGAVLAARGFGYANLEHMVPVTAETIFQSGSLGKMFTAVAVMLQVEDGKLALSDPLTKFFPDAPNTWRDITVRHLLTHTSGIPDYTTDEFDYRKDYTEDELARLAYATQLEFAPGSRWNYSNTGYALLGFIVRRASGKFYGDVLAERVFKPLGMTGARVISEADLVPHRSAGYRLVRGEIKNQNWVAPELNTTADGSLYFSLRDLLAWEAGVRRRALLKPESWQQILSPVRLASGKPYPYGFGWSVDERRGQPLHSHGGAWQGFKTQLSRFIGDDLTIIVLANLAQADPGRVADGIAAILNPNLAVVPPAPIPDREPNVTAQLHRILDAARDGKLTPADFAYVRAGFFPATAKYYEELLKRLGKPARTQLVERREVGDDRVYRYELTFGDRVYMVSLGLAPDNRVAQFALFEKR
ncbi:MAG TPA: serine hydrolase [Gemmatimonadaceae bacterium]|nr:serine hydrolase [Gemmatimonadaceae bacterium]